MLRHDIQPEYSIKYSRISLTRVTKRTSLAAKGYEYGKNKDVEYTRIFCDGAGRGGLEKFMQLSKLKSWVSTWVVLNWVVESKSLGKWQIPTDVHLSAYWLDNWLKALPTYGVEWISHLGLINPLTEILQRKRQVNCGITKHNSNTNSYEHKIISCWPFTLQYFLHFIPGLPPMSKAGYSQHYELCSSPPESRCST